MKTLATIDFSGASDSIASMLVLDLLPSEWFDALDRCRSHRHCINGEWKNLQKFSSMGNGFTFELETLIFLSLARACCDHLGLPNHFTSVYGDDVIIPDEAAALFFKVSDFCGFTVNSDKSFWGDDAFRESCGSDWMDGTDVRVAYMRHEVSPHYLITLHNRIVYLGLHYWVPQTIAALRDAVPKQFRRFGAPSEHMYGYLFDPDSVHKKPVQAIKFVPRQHRPKGRPVVAYALYASQFSIEDTLAADAYNHARKSHGERFISQRYGLYLDLEAKSGAEGMPTLAITLGSSHDAPMSMERFTVRRDFKLSTVEITATGLIKSSNGSGSIKPPKVKWWLKEEPVKLDVA